MLKNNTEIKHVVLKYIFRLLARLRVSFSSDHIGEFLHRMCTCNLHAFTRAKLSWLYVANEFFRERLHKSARRTADRTLLSYWPSVWKQETEAATCLCLEIARETASATLLRRRVFWVTLMKRNSMSDSTLDFFLDGATMLTISLIGECSYTRNWFSRAEICREIFIVTGSCRHLRTD